MLNLIIFCIFISNLKKYKSLPFYFSVIRDGAHGPWADRGRCNQEVIHVIAGHESLATPPPPTFLGILKTEDLGSREHAQPILWQLMYKAKYEVPASVIWADRHWGMTKSYEREIILLIIMKILDTGGKMYWLWHCLPKGKGQRNALCLSRLILSEVSQGGTFYVIGSTGLSVGVGSSAPWLAAPQDRKGENKAESHLSGLCSWAGKKKPSLGIIVNFELTFMYSHGKKGSEVFGRTSIQKDISRMSHKSMTKVFQGAGRLLNHSTLLAVKMENVAHLDVAAHREGSSRDVQRLYFNGSTTTILGLFKAFRTGGRNKGYREVWHSGSQTPPCISDRWKVPQDSCVKALSPV